MNTIIEHIQYIFTETYKIPKDEILESKEQTAYDKLLETLNDEQKKLFDAFLDAHLSLETHDLDETYKSAFSIGVRTVIESLSHPLIKY